MNEDEANVPDPQAAPPLADLNIPKGKSVAVLAGTLRAVQRFSEVYPTLDVLSASSAIDLRNVDDRSHVLIRLNGWENNPLANSVLLDVKFPNWRSTSEQCLLPDRPSFDPSHPLARTLAEAQRANARLFSTPSMNNPFLNLRDAITPPSLSLDEMDLILGERTQNDALDARRYNRLNAQEIGEAMRSSGQSQRSSDQEGVKQ